MYICTSYFQQFHEIKMFTSYKSNFQEGYIAELTRFSDLNQRAKVGMLCRQNERNSRYIRLAHTSIFGLYFISVCLMKSNCYSLIYSSLIKTILGNNCQIGNICREYIYGPVQAISAT